MSISLPPHFELGPKIGDGSLGEVYRARNVFTGRDYAFKIIFPELARDGILVRRLRREARAMLRLRHPNIISVYDCGLLTDGRLYITTEYVPGDSLAVLLRRRRPPLELGEAMVLLRQLARALAHAHERGVVHRDLRPENILVHRSEAGLSCKLVDFGFAKIVDARYTETFNISVAAGPSVRSAEYGSPEQLSGQAVDQRADIYAFGCVAFAVLTSGPPFQGPRVADIARSHVTAAPPPLSSRMADLTLARAMEPIVARCLEKDPARRYQSASELAFAIGVAPTGAGRAGGESVVAQHRRAALLKEVAEELVDEGRDDVELMVELATVSASLVELQHCEQSEATLKTVREELEYDARAREGHLRVAIGHLRQTSSRAAAGVIAGELQRLIAEYLEQIADTCHAAAQDCGQLDERLVSLEHRKKMSSERLKAQSRRLDRCLTALLPDLVAPSAELGRLLSEAYPARFPMGKRA